ncbi:tRNA-guanine transglycosylase, partial [Candidatus Microgenomates bacterium]|nr:tRNA-guanine transglycosylase [Candidatus Microgenomates bacterium]
MPKLRFEIKSRDKKTRARTGIINTTHGIIRTPAFVPVGSGATVKALTPQELKTCGIDVFFVNTYHMYFRPNIETVKKCGGLHKFSNWNGPIMTDSGGFQAFSLGEGGPRQNNPQNEK